MEQGRKVKRGDIVFARLSHFIINGNPMKAARKATVVMVQPGLRRALVNIDGEERFIPFNAIVRPIKAEVEHVNTIQDVINKFNIGR